MTHAISLYEPITLDAMESDLLRLNVAYFLVDDVILGMLDIPSGPESVEASTL